MARAENFAAKRQDILKIAKNTLNKELGYEKVEDSLVEGETCAVARRSGRPMVLVYIPEAPGPISPSTQELAIQLRATIHGGPAGYMCATATDQLGDGRMYSWLPGKGCQVSRIPPVSELAKNGPSDASRARPKADPIRFKELRHEFDELHEQVYASREPIDGSNDLTAQLCKCI